MSIRGPRRCRYRDRDWAGSSATTCDSTTVSTTFANLQRRWASFRMTSSSPTSPVAAAPAGRSSCRGSVGFQLIGTTVPQRWATFAPRPLARQLVNAAKAAKVVADRYRTRGTAGNAKVICNAHAQAALPCRHCSLAAASRRRTGASTLIGRRSASVRRRAEPQALHAGSAIDNVVAHAFGWADTAGGRADNEHAHDGATRIDRAAAVAHVRALAQPVRDRRRLLG